MVDNRTLKKKPASHSRKATVAEEKITVVLKIEKKKRRRTLFTFEQTREC